MLADAAQQDLCTCSDSEISNSNRNTSYLLAQPPQHIISDNVFVYVSCFFNRSLILSEWIRRLRDDYCGIRPYEFLAPTAGWLSVSSTWCYQCMFVGLDLEISHNNATLYTRHLSTKLYATVCVGCRPGWRGPRSGGGRSGMLLLSFRLLFNTLTTYGGVTYDYTMFTPPSDVLNAALHRGMTLIQHNHHTFHSVSGENDDALPENISPQDDSISRADCLNITSADVQRLTGCGNDSNEDHSQQTCRLPPSISLLCGNTLRALFFPEIKTSLMSISIVGLRTAISAEYYPDEASAADLNASSPFLASALVITNNTFFARFWPAAASSFPSAPATTLAAYVIIFSFLTTVMSGWQGKNTFVRTLLFVCDNQVDIAARLAIPSAAGGYGGTSLSIRGFSMLVVVPPGINTTHIMTKNRILDSTDTTTNIDGNRDDDAVRLCPTPSQEVRTIICQNTFVVQNVSRLEATLLYSASTSLPSSSSASPGGGTWNASSFRAAVYVVENHIVVTNATLSVAPVPQPTIFDVVARAFSIAMAAADRPCSFSACETPTVFLGTPFSFIGILNNSMLIRNFQSIVNNVSSGGTADPTPADIVTVRRVDLAIGANLIVACNALTGGSGGGGGGGIPNSVHCSNKSSPHDELNTVLVANNQVVFQSSMPSMPKPSNSSAILHASHVGTVNVMSQQPQATVPTVPTASTIRVVNNSFFLSGRDAFLCVKAGGDSGARCESVLDVDMEAVDLLTTNAAANVTLELEANDFMILSLVAASLSVAVVNTVSSTAATNVTLALKGSGGTRVGSEGLNVTAVFTINTIAQVQLPSSATMIILSDRTQYQVTASLSQAHVVSLMHGIVFGPTLPMFSTAYPSQFGGADRRGPPSLSSSIEFLNHSFVVSTNIVGAPLQCTTFLMGIAMRVVNKTSVSQVLNVNSGCIANLSLDIHDSTFVSSVKTNALNNSVNNGSSNRDGLIHLNYSSATTTIVGSAPTVAVIKQSSIMVSNSSGTIAGGLVSPFLNEGRHLIEVSSCDITGVAHSFLIAAPNSSSAATVVVSLTVQGSRILGDTTAVVPQTTVKNFLTVGGTLLLSTSNQSSSVTVLLDDTIVSYFTYLVDHDASILLLAAPQLQSTSSSSHNVTITSACLLWGLSRQSIAPTTAIPIAWKAAYTPLCTSMFRNGTTCRCGSATASAEASSTMSHSELSSLTPSPPSPRSKTLMLTATATLLVSQYTASISRGNVSLSSSGTNPTKMITGETITKTYDPPAPAFTFYDIPTLPTGGRTVIAALGAIPGLAPGLARSSAAQRLGALCGDDGNNDVDLGIPSMTFRVVTVNDSASQNAVDSLVWFVIVLAAAFVVLALVALRFKFVETSLSFGLAFAAACEKLSLPGALLVGPLALLVPALLGGGIVALLSSEEDTIASMCVGALSLIVAVIIINVDTYLLTFGFVGFAAERSGIATSRRPSSRMWYHQLISWLQERHPLNHWIAASPDDNTHERFIKWFSPLFSMCRHGRHWYSLVEQGLGLVVAVLEGCAELPNLTSSVCGFGLWLVCGVQIAAVAIVVVLQPFAVRWEQLLMSLLALLAALSALCIALRVDANVASAFDMVQTVVAALLLVLDGGMRVYRFSRALMKKLTLPNPMVTNVQQHQEPKLLLSPTDFAPRKPRGRNPTPSRQQATTLIKITAATDAVNVDEVGGGIESVDGKEDHDDTRSGTRRGERHADGAGEQQLHLAKSSREVDQTVMMTPLSFLSRRSVKRDSSRHSSSSKAVVVNPPEEKLKMLVRYICLRAGKK